MKKLKKELDVDFIGGHGEMTKEEEKSISEYIKKQKLKLKLPSEIKRTKKAA